MQGGGKSALREFRFRVKFRRPPRVAGIPGLAINTIWARTHTWSAYLGFEDDRKANNTIKPIGAISRR
jgi:hypothetical protein